MSNWLEDAHEEAKQFEERVIKAKKEIVEVIKEIESRKNLTLKDIKIERFGNDALYKLDYTFETKENK